MNNQERIGRFTSSNIYKLMKMGKREMTSEELLQYKIDNPKSRAKTMYCDKLFAEIGMTYIKEKAIEHRVANCLDANGAYSTSMAWGKLMERIVFDTCGLEYRMISKETSVHPEYKFWSGSADLIVPEIKASEIKCYQYKAFAEFTDALLTKDIEFIKENFEKEYYQVVSNSIIHGFDKAELISYMPYETELKKIIQLIEDTNILEANNLEPWEYRFMTEKPFEMLSYLPDDGYYDNMTKFEFEIPKTDVDFVTKRVVLANEELKKEIAKYKK